MPWIDLDGAVNVRDVGGLPAVDGGPTVPGLLRSDNLQALSPADVRRLVDDLGVTTVIDLRSSAERAAEGAAPLDAVPGLRRLHHPVIPELGSATDVAADALLVKLEQRRSRFPADPMCGFYLGYLEDRPDQVAGAVPQHRPGRGHGPGALRGRQGPHRRGGGPGPDRGRGTAGGRGGRLRRHRRADRRHPGPAAELRHVRRGHRPQAGRGAPAAPGDH